MVSPCPGQVNSEFSQSPKCEPTSWVTQEKFSSLTPASQRVSNSSFPNSGRSGRGWYLSGSEGVEPSFCIQRGYKVLRTSFGAPVNPNFRNHKMELTPLIEYKII